MKRIAREQSEALKKKSCSNENGLNRTEVKNESCVKNVCEQSRKDTITWISEELA